MSRALEPAIIVAVPLYEDLVRRALDAKARSDEIRLDSERIISLAQMLRQAAAGHVSIVRCAWCGRLKVGEEWLHLEAIGSGQQQINSSLMARASHGICPQSFEQQEDLRSQAEVEAASLPPRTSSSKPEEPPAGSR